MFTYASMAPPHPDWLMPVAVDVDALEVLVEVDWAVARLAAARMRAVVYCMIAFAANVEVVGLYYIT